MAQPRRAGRARRVSRNWCDAAAPTAIRHAPRDGLRPRSGTVPPATAYRPRPGAAPPATAPRPRSGAVPPRRRIGIGLVPRPPRQRFDPALGATTFALAPRSGAVPPLGTTTLALGPRPSLWCRAPVTAFRHRSGAAPSGSGRLSRRDAAIRAALCWRRLRRPSRYRPPGSGLFCRKTGSNLTPFRGFWAVISVPRCDSRRWLRYNPRSEAFTSSVPRSAAYETAQSFARALCRTLDRAKNGVMGLRNRPKLHSGVWPPSAG